MIDEGGNSTFISWCSDPVQYAVGISNLSFFGQSLPVIRDMGKSEFWKALIGQDVDISFVDKQHQVLEIASDKKVYCWTSAFEEEGQDTLFISAQIP